MPTPKRALVIEGGGMKAAYANGVLSAFEEAGYAPFDAVYGTSAGGALAAWYSAKQARYAEETWKYAADPRIMSYWRFLGFRGPLLDHDALLDIIYVREMPIDQKAIQAARWPVIVTAADVDSGEAWYQDIRQGRIIDWLRATGRLPFASGPPVEIDGRRYLDGGILDPIPVRRAVADGATEVLIIRNKPAGPRKPDPALIVNLAARRYPRLRDGILRHSDIKQDAADFARRPPAGVRIDTIRPEAATRLHRLTRDLTAIRDGLQVGRRDGHAYLRALDRDSDGTATHAGLPGQSPRRLNLGREGRPSAAELAA